MEETTAQPGFLAAGAAGPSMSRFADRLQPRLAAFADTGDAGAL